MGIFETIFKKPKAEELVAGYFKTLAAYQPVFTSYDGGVYEMELTRAAIHAIASQASKLKPEMTGNAYKELGERLKFQPNPWQDTTKFLYRLVTILMVRNTAFIVPITDDGIKITGYFPLLPTQTEIIEYKGEPYLRYTFSNGRKAAIEFSKVGVLTQMQYKDDFFGADNSVLDPLMQLMNVQNQGIIEGVKQSATIRFMAKLANTFKSADIAAERLRFTQDNLSYENNSGVLMFDNKYSEVKQIDSKPFIIDDKQMALIKTSVFNYFGVNEKILQNDFTEDSWNAFYEGKLETIAIQLSLVMSNMTFTQREIAHGNQIMFTANRLQYATNETKLAIVTQLFDRGFLTHNMGAEIFNMTPRADGDKFYIRREYAEVDKLHEAPKVEDITEEPKGDEQIDNKGQAVSQV